MALIKKEPVMFPKICHYRLNQICEKQKASLSPRCISLLTEKSSDTKNIRKANSAQSSMEHLLLTATEHHLKRYGLQCCRRLPDVSFSHGQLLHSQEPNPQCNASYPYRKDWKSSGNSNFGLQVISCQPGIKDLILEDKELTRPKRKQAQSLRQRIPLIKVIVMESPESLRKAHCPQKVQKESIPIVQSALSFVSVMGTRLKTTNVYEDFEIQNQIKYTPVKESLYFEEQKETEYLQVVSSPPRIKKIMSCNASKMDRGRNLHDHLLCERFEMHMSNHLQRSKSEILQKSYSSHIMEQLYPKTRPVSSGSAIKKHSMKSQEFYRKLHSWKASNSEMENTPPTSPEFYPESHVSLSQQEVDTLSVRSDFGPISAQNESFSSLVDPEARHKTKPNVLDREKDGLLAEKDKTLDNFSEKDQGWLQSVKDRLNLLPGEKGRQRRRSETLSGKEEKDYLSALSHKQDLRSVFYDGVVSKQETILDAEQRNVILASPSTSKDGESFQQNPDAHRKEKETSADSQRKETQEKSLHSSRQIIKKEKKSRHFSSSTSKEAKSEEDHKTDISNEKKNVEKDNFPIDKEDGIQVKLGKPKLPSFQQKLLNFGKKSSKMKLTPLSRHSDVQELLKPLPGHRHKQYFDPQEMAERRRQKLLEKMNQKKLLFDDTSPTVQSLFQDYGWLAKYCIFNKDNWKIYGRTFEAADTKNKGWLTPKETMMALRTANSQLTPSEEEYLCRIIEMTGYSIEEGSDMRLFSVLAALSHRITSLEIEQINKSSKVTTSTFDSSSNHLQTLWECNVDPETNKISLDQLMVELRVGGVSLAHEREANDHLQHLKALDLLDFLTYIPLFIMIHESVVDNPLDFSRRK